MNAFVDIYSHYEVLKVAGSKFIGSSKKKRAASGVETSPYESLFNLSLHVFFQ